jgi:hypothetical protein
MGSELLAKGQVAIAIELRSAKRTNPPPGF